MFCTSCQAEINPKWKYAISMNNCPSCGEQIMDENLKLLLTTLTATIDALKEYPDQLDDWLLSNHNYIRTDSKKIIDFTTKGIEQNKFEKSDTITLKDSSGKEQEVIVKKIQSDKKTDEFFKRAEAVKPGIDGFQSTAEKTQHLKGLAAEIRKAGSTNAQTLLDNDSEINQEELNEVNSIMVEDSSSFNSDDDIPAVVQAMARSGHSNSAASNRDLLRLQQMQDRVNNAKDSFESGANRGKNGFSRSL